MNFKELKVLCLFCSIPLVSFGELSEVMVHDSLLLAVTAIEDDWLNPGGFIVGNRNSVAMIFPNGSMQTLAGRGALGSLLESLDYSEI